MSVFFLSKRMLYILNFMCVNLKEPYAENQSYFAYNTHIFLVFKTLRENGK